MFGALTARLLNSNCADDITLPEHLIHDGPDAMDIFVADLDEDGA